MNTTNTPTDEIVLRDLTLLTPVVHRALESATLQTREFFDEMGKPINLSLAPCLVRYFAKEFLDGAGHQVVEEEEEVEYQRQSLANNGLLLHCSRYWIRILKADQDGLPAAGPSGAKQAFYAQQLPLRFLDSEGVDEQPHRINLVILWHVDHLYNLTKFSIAYPKAASETRSEVHWHVDIPHPIHTMMSNGSVGSGDDIVDDLEIVLSDSGGGRINQTAG